MTNMKDDDNIGSFYMGRRNWAAEPRRVMPRGLLTVVTVVAFGGLIWYAYPQGQEKYTDIEVPVIAADTAPYKSKPSDPGGMEVPHRDSTVYESLDRKSRPARPEKVVSKKEEPIDRKKLGLDPEKAALNLTPEAPASAAAPEAIMPPDVQEDPKAAAALEKVEAPPAQEEETKAPPVQEEAGEKAEAPPAPAPAAETEPTYFDESATLTWLQIGAFKSESSAKTGWEKLQKKHAALKGLSTRTQKADLGKKGVLYRLQAGAPSAAKAKEICGEVTAAGGACVVVK